MKYYSETFDRRGFLKTGGAIGAIALAGCSGDGDGGETGNGGGQTGETGGSDEATITWWHAMSGELGQVVDDMVSDFNEQSDGVRVETTFQGSYIETLNSVIAAIREGNQPTIAQISVSETRTARDSGAFESIEDVMGDRLDFDDYVAPVAEGFAIEGEISALPFNNSNPILYLNGDMLEDAGYDPEDLPTTFQGILEASRTIVDDGHADYGISFGNDPWFINQWFGTMDQPIVNNENGHAADPPAEMYLTSDASFEIYEWWRTMADEGVYFNPGAKATPGAQEAFNNEDVAMIISSTAGLADVSGNTDFTLETTYYPAPEGTWTGLSPGGAGLHMSAELPEAERQGAIDFFSWLSETAQQVRWHKETGYFPITESALSELESGDWFSENPNFRTAVDQLKDTEVTTASRGYLVGPSPEMESHFIDFGSRMLSTDRDLEVILEDAETQGEAILADYNESRA